MEKFTTSIRVYELYRQMEMDWQHFQPWAAARGLPFRSPQQVVDVGTANQLLELFHFKPAVDQEELLMRLRGVLLSMPAQLAQGELVALLRSFPLGEERRFALEYARQHIDAARLEWPQNPLFDWHYIAPKELLWESLRLLVEEGCEDHARDSVAILYDTDNFFKKRDTPEAAMAWGPSARVEQAFATVDPLWGCDETLEGWRDMLLGIGFWEHPAHEQRCWSWFRKWSQEKSLDNWNKIQRLKLLWAEAEPTKLVLFEMEESLAEWDEVFFAPASEEFLREFSAIGDEIHKQLDYMGLVVRYIGERKASGVNTSEHGLSQRVLSQFKRVLVSEASSEARKGWKLTVRPASLAAASMLRESLCSVIRYVGDSTRREVLRAKIEQGLRVLESGVCEVTSNRRLTCCGSTVYLLKAPQGYFGIQFYSFC